MDLLAKPMQRLTRYSLLLNSILKRTENEEHSRALEQMVSSNNLQFSIFVLIV